MASAEVWKINESKLIQWILLRPRRNFCFSFSSPTLDEMETTNIDRFYLYPPHRTAYSTLWRNFKWMNCLSSFTFSPKHWRLIGFKISQDCGGTFTFNLITPNRFHSWHSYFVYNELKSVALKWNQVERNPTIISPARIFIKIRYVITDKFKVHNIWSLVHLFRPGDVKWPTMHELTDKVQIRLCHLGDPRRPSLNGQRFSAVLFVHAF